MSKYFSLFIRIWKLLKPFQHIFYVQIFLISVLGAADIYRRVILGKIIDEASSKNIDGLMMTFVMLVLFQAIYWTIDYYKYYAYKIKFARKSYHHLREFSLRKILKLNIFQFNDSNSTIRYDVIATGEDRSITVVETIMLNILPSIVLFIFAAFTLFSYSKLLGIISIISSIIIFILEGKFQNGIRPMRRIAVDANRIQYKVSLETFSHLSLIKSLSIENKFIRDFMSKREINMNYNIQIDKKESHYYGRRDYVLSGLNLLCTFIAIKFYIAGDINIGSIFVVFSITNDVFQKTKNLQLDFNRIATNYIDIEKYLDLIDLQPEFNEHGKLKLPSKDKVKSKVAEGGEDKVNNQFNTEIVFTNLTFKYPKGDSNVLENINLTIPHGKRVAFVGHSGSGKTTIVKLLMRAYDYAGVVPLPLREGLGVGVASITIGGLELRDIDSHSLRSAIGYVEQHVDLFDTTVRDNILMSVCEGTLTKWEKKKTPTPTLPQGEGATQNSFIDQKLEEVSRLARIDEFYHRLGEKKWDTEIGERGIKLSGGERQRVGIARAIIKDPSILILDEATSALDTINEKYIKEAIDNVSVGRTTIIIAHRLSTVEDADMIVVMDRGQVVATGTHSNLLLSSTHYQELIEAQLK